MLELLKCCRPSHFLCISSSHSLFLSLFFSASASRLRQMNSLSMGSSTLAAFTAVSPTSATTLPPSLPPPTTIPRPVNPLTTPESLRSGLKGLASSMTTSATPLHPLNLSSGKEDFLLTIAGRPSSSSLTDSGGKTTTSSSSLSSQSSSSSVPSSLSLSEVVHGVSPSSSLSLTPSATLLSCNSPSSPTCLTPSSTSSFIKWNNTNTTIQR